ncbi:MAG TPA: cytidine deaminase [Polyangiaceae bacterium]
MSELAPELRELVLAARAVREHAYAPYSSFFVGAALRTRDGEVFTGCNVENASYGATICAERAAICAMVAGAKRASTRRLRVAAIAVFTDAAELAMPCGVCRQVLSEFAERTVVVVANPREQRVMAFAELFPAPFVLRGGDDEP